MSVDERIDTPVERRLITFLTMSSYTVQADGRSRRAGSSHGALKVAKRRAERRKANRNPESIPSYGRYRGYET